MIQQTLPPLVKKSSTYKLIVPTKVEEKIRYLQRKYPTTEWSGVLFTTHEGSFENNDLVITCQDIYPMDLGSSTFTQYNMDETVAGYIADNIELFSCDINMVHSHNQLAAFLSGTDLENLRQEGADKNCYISLVVNNTGPYCAAITRRIKTKTKVTTKSLGSSYQFFGEGAVTTEEESSETTKIVEEEVIEYYMLDVTRELVNNPLEYLDDRFDEIEKKKVEDRKNQFVSSYPTNNKMRKDFEDNYSFKDWQEKKYSKVNAVQQNLFDDKTMKEMEADIPIEIPNEEIHKCVAQMLTCSLFINVKNFNMDSWIKHNMKDLYDVRFSGFLSFDSWADFIVDFLIENFPYECLNEEECYDNNLVQSAVANAMYEELSAYQDENKYIGEYLEVLNRYIV